MPTIELNGMGRIEKLELVKARVTKEMKRKLARLARERGKAEAVLVRQALAMLIADEEKKKSKPGR